MKLTSSEEQERLELQKPSTKIPMSPKDYNRLKYLNNKYWHNECSNPRCLGYLGTDQETDCPICLKELNKLI